MTQTYRISIDGKTIVARRGQLLLDAALGNAVDLPHDCRSGHCGTCCVRLVSGAVSGGEGSEPGIVHACQCRIVGDAVIERRQRVVSRTVEGRVSSLHPLSPDILEVGIRVDRPLPHHAGQYAQVRFRGYPDRPFSITHPVRGASSHRQIWFHVRRMRGGRVTPSLGHRIRSGHQVRLTGPFGSAHFRRDLDCRLILVATNTGFAPIWSIAVAALHENPERQMVIIAGARALDSLYMFPALAQLARFPNVVVVPVCSSLHAASGPVLPGRPTDYLPRLVPTDVIYACGAPSMIDAVKSIATHAGAICHADPFLPTKPQIEKGIFNRAAGWLAAPARGRIGAFAADGAGRRQSGMTRAALLKPW